MFSHPSFSMPGNCMSAPLSHVMKSFVPVYSICGSCGSCTFAGMALVDFGTLHCSVARRSHCEGRMCCGLLKLKPPGSHLNAAKQKPDYDWTQNKFITFMYSVVVFFVINSRVTSAENRGPHNILDQCLKVMDIWNSLPDVFISLYNACWAHPVLFTWSI